MPIRHRLLIVLLLGALTSALSLTALVHLLSTTTTQRAERAREAVREALAALVRDPEHREHYAPASVIGMRGGILSANPEASGVPKDWSAALARVRGAANLDPGRPAIEQHATDTGTLVLGVVRSNAPVREVWAGYMVRPLPSIGTWQEIVGLLAFATVLLVATSVVSIVTMQRGVGELQASLTALAVDLDAEVPRSAIRELSDIAGGIAHLAQSLGEAREHEERLGRELAQNERLAALGRVVAGVAHEVRNPLASIKLRLDLARNAADLPPAVEHAIAHASSEIARLDRLVADMLIVAGRARGPRREISLGELWRERATALSPWAQERWIAIVCSGDARAAVDVDSLARAIDNLLRNAVEASPPGAEVRVHVLAEPAHGVTMTIEDRGIGVADARRAELFEPFFTTKPDGTGLGLAISRAIARAHGGDLVYGRSDGITRFELTLASNLSREGERAA